MTTTEWHEQRRTGIGGSDAAAIMGLSPWTKPMDVWLAKLGLAEPDTPSLRMFIGERLEPLIAEMFTARTGVAVERYPDLIRDPSRPWMIGHVDYRPLEIKTSMSRRGWGDDGSVVTEGDPSAIPLHYLIQVQHYLIITGWPKMHVAVLIGHDDFRTYEVEPMPTLQGDIIDSERWFWNLVETEEPPPIDGSPASQRWLKIAYPQDNGIIRPATPEEENAIAMLVKVKGRIRELEQSQAQLENVVKERIGEDRGLRASGMEAIWSTVNRKQQTNWEGVADAYRTLLLERSASDAEELSAVVGLHSSVPDSYRRLTVTQKGDSDA